MDWTNETPWHGTGVDIETNLSPREIMIRADIDQQLSKNKRLKSRANEKAVRFFKAFADAGEARVVAFGNLESEPILWTLTELDENFTLPGGDELKGCMLLSSKGEKRETVQIQFLILRPANNSTLMAPVKMRSTFKNILLDAVMFDAEMIQRAKELAAAGRVAISAFAEDARSLSDCKVDGPAANRFMFDLFQPDLSRELPSLGEEEIEDQAEPKTKKAIEAVKNAPGQDLESAQMTVWGLLNAVMYTVDHVLVRNPDSSLRQAWFGFNANVKKRALELALELAQRK